MRFILLLAACLLIPGCYEPPGPGPVPPEEIAAVADRSMDKLRANYADLSEQVADMIRDGKITSAEDEIDALLTASEQAYLDAQREIEQLRDRINSGGWNAAAAERFHRQSAKGYRQ